jgi:hypothetical protein
MPLEKESVEKELAGIREFFDYTRSRILSVSAIEQEAEIPKNTLLNVLKANRTIATNHISSLVEVLAKVGYQAQENWSQFKTGGIYFYFNYPNRKVTLHRGECSFCKNGEGAQTNKLGEINGGWRGGFDSYESAVVEAQQIAQEIAVIPMNCSRCNPQDN